MEVTQQVNSNNFSLNDVNILKATQKQLYPITVLTRRFFPYTKFTLEKILERLASKNISYFVALHDGHTIGFVDIEFIGDEAKVLGLAVLEEFRNKGVGTRLLKKAISFTEEKNAKAINLFVSTDNTLALSLYKKHGFLVRGVLDRRIGDKEILVARKEFV